jgi:hypothetical protein|tara:strand:- start:54 stop:254 length:201 start_codon:yes stop_codon:yes gene_type:complete
MKLKTLKDFESNDESVDLLLEIRQEAIKWIKSYRDNELTEHINVYGIGHKIDWIMNFFNIKREELE